MQFHRLAYIDAVVNTDADSKLRSFASEATDAGWLEQHVPRSRPSRWLSETAHEYANSKVYPTYAQEQELHIGPLATACPTERLVRLFARNLFLPTCCTSTVSSRPRHSGPRDIFATAVNRDEIATYPPSSDRACLEYTSDSMTTVRVAGSFLW